MGERERVNKGLWHTNEHALFFHLTSACTLYLYTCLPTCLRAYYNPIHSTPGGKSSKQKKSELPTDQSPNYSTLNTLRNTSFSIRMEQNVELVGISTLWEKEVSTQKERIKSPPCKKRSLFVTTRTQRQIVFIIQVHHAHAQKPTRGGGAWGEDKGLEEDVISHMTTAVYFAYYRYIYIYITTIYNYQLTKRLIHIPCLLQASGYIHTSTNTVPRSHAN